jgi:hypothetical protein
MRGVLFGVRAAATAAVGKRDGWTMALEEEKKKFHPFAFVLEREE